MPGTAELSAREVYQILKDVAMGQREVRAVGRPQLDQMADEHLAVEIDGWHLTFRLTGKQLAYCAHGQSPDGRSAGLEQWQRFGANPADLLSAWEYAQLVTKLGSV